MVGTAVAGQNASVSLGVGVPLGVTLTDTGTGVAGDTVTVNVAGVNVSGTLSGLMGPNGSPIVILTSSLNVLGLISVPAGTELMLSNSSIATGTSVAITAGTLCIMQGTRLLTETGLRRVEELRPGDRIVTASGALRPIQWMGHQSVADGWALEGTSRPVRIAAGAIADGIPSVDLWTSPEHAVFQDGVLIPVRCLVNGHSIVHAPRDSFTYWHVGLETHDVMFAEGLTIETLLADAGNIEVFDNADTAALPDPFMAPCAPMLTQGPRVEAVRARIDARARVFA